MVEEGKKTKKTNEKNTFVGGRLCKGEGEGCRPAMPEGRRRSCEGGGRDGRSREGEGKSRGPPVPEGRGKVLRGGKGRSL